MRKYLLFSILLLAVFFAGCSDSSRNSDRTPSKPTINIPSIWPEKDSASTINPENSYDPDPHVHAFGEWSVVSEATCTNPGLKERRCSCGESEYEYTDLAPHTVVTDPAVAATCTAEGKSEGKHCAVCQEILEEQTVLPQISHNYDKRTCTACGLEPDVVVKRIWSEETGKSVKANDTFTFCVEAYFKYRSGSFVVWFKSIDNPNSIACAVTVSDTEQENIYSVTLNIDGNMFPGKWVADWYYIADQYNTYAQNSFTEQEQENLWFIYEPAE